MNILQSTQASSSNAHATNVGGPTAGNGKGIGGAGAEVGAGAGKGIAMNGGATAGNGVGIASTPRNRAGRDVAPTISSLLEKIRQRKKGGRM